MACPICFFRDKAQRELKIKCFGIESFQKKLEMYKKLFIHEINDLGSIADCDCYSSFNNDKLIIWTDDFLSNLKYNIIEIESTFDQLISCYNEFSKNKSNYLWDFITQNDLFVSSNNIQEMRFLFRGRSKGDYNNQNILELFHVKYSKRNLISNQRFSIKNEPMLYLGSSIVLIEKELSDFPEKLNYAAYFPIYSFFYNKKIFDLKNYFNEVIEKSLPGIFDSDLSFTYSDKNILPNYESIKKDIKRTILMQICTFPTENINDANEEYILPQLLTTTLKEHDFVGIVYPTTKDFADFNDSNKFSYHHMNVGFFVQCSKENEIDSNLFNSFIKITLEGKNTYDLSLDSVREERESLVSKLNHSKDNNNDIKLVIANMNLQLEYLSKSKLHNDFYFDTIAGKIELELYMKMLKKINGILK